MLYAVLLAMVTPNYLPVACGRLNTEYTMVLQANGSYAGRLYESTSCSSGGRGSKPRRYATCLNMTWDVNGNVISHETLWTDIGYTVRGADACFE